PGAAGNRKYPSIAGNAQGETLLAWTEGMGWKKGGGLAWQVFDRSGHPIGSEARVPGVPVWSLVAESRGLAADLRFCIEFAALLRKQASLLVLPAQSRTCGG